jgi:hypothetical protein
MIVGAGASAEAGLPTGNGLTRSIASLLRIEYGDGFRQSSGSRVIEDAIRQIAERSDRDRAGLLRKKASTIADAMGIAASIDNYVDAHRNDQDVAYLAKLAIAESILAGEATSRIARVCSIGARSEDERVLDGTWYIPFARTLFTGVSANEIARAFSNLTTVTFNYDRCIELFLRWAVKKYYNVSDQDAASAVGQLAILHVFGTLGELPVDQRDKSNHFVSFGANQTAAEPPLLSRTPMSGDNPHSEVSNGKASAVLG